jgi:hydroxyacylglutathione hydrolase
MKIPLEDLFEDIVGKAQRGLGISDQELAQKSGLNLDQVRSFTRGAGDPKSIKTLAPVLGLDSKALVASFKKSWYPESVPVLEAVKQVNTPLMDMTVNAYLIWDPATKDAAIFDTGADASELLATVSGGKLTVKYIFLTHTHEDHVAELGRLIKQLRAEIYSPDQERVSDTKIVREGDQFRLGSLRVEARLTNGHSPGGTSYVVTGLEVPVAVVGDSLFAGSMGGAPNAYQRALRNNEEKLLTLPGETLICPGHGPLTTVLNEQKNNPFFAKKS